MDPGRNISTVIGFETYICCCQRNNWKVWEVMNKNLASEISFSTPVQIIKQPLLDRSETVEDFVTNPDTQCRVYLSTFG